jgi:hypothetical protein
MHDATRGKLDLVYASPMHPGLPTKHIVSTVKVQG